MNFYIVLNYKGDRNGRTGRGRSCTKSTKYERQPEEAILAFNELIRRNYEKIYKIAYLSLNFNKEDAEDIVQMVATEVFVR